MTNLSPLQILCVIAAPKGGLVEGDRSWHEREGVLAQLVRSGGIVLSKLEQGRFRALEAEVCRGVSVVHIVVGLEARPEVGFFAFQFETAGKEPHRINVPTLGAVLRKGQGLSLVILECATTQPELLELVAARIAEECDVALIVLPRLDATVTKVFLLTLYSALAVGEGVESSMQRTRDSLVASGFASMARAVTLRPSSRVSTDSAIDRQGAKSRDAGRQGATAEMEGNAIGPDPAQQLESEREFERKKVAGTFDVFLCHNSVDKPAVMEIGQQLMKRGIRPWLDVWNLPPGQPWLPIIEDQIKTIPAVAVFVGGHDYGRWQREEVQAFLAQCVSRGVPVIPVLLPLAPDEAEISSLLNNRTRIDFRISDPDPVGLLVWGVREAIDQRSAASGWKP